MRNALGTIGAEQQVSDADYFQLSRVVTELAWRVDEGRADTLYELFTIGGELTLPNGVIRGREAIQAWGRQIVDNAPWRTIRHICGNMRFVYDGENAAVGTTMLTVFMVAIEQVSLTIPYSVGEDHDRFIRTPAGWKVTSRRWLELFERGDALELPKEI
jgi:hypothetical protein